VLDSNRWSPTDGQLVLVGSVTVTKGVRTSNFHFEGRRTRDRDVVRPGVEGSEDTLLYFQTLAHMGVDLVALAARGGVLTVGEVGPS